MKRTIRGLAVVFLVMVFPLGVIGKADINYITLDSYIAKAVKDFELMGLAIAVVKDSTVVFSKGYGFKDVTTQDPITTGSLFNIASCTKAMTAACLAVLVEEGKLKWKDKVIDYLPEFRLTDPYLTREMNLIDILSHRSGLGTFYGDLLWYETDYSNEEIIKRMRHLPITNDFRSDFGYQNNMYMIAGEIIKKITGKTWSEFVYNRIFKPLDMPESKTNSKDVKSSQDIAYPHLDGKLQELAIYKPNPAGTVYSSVDEMANWITMLLNGGTWKGGKVLSPSVIDRLFSPQTILPVSSFMRQNGSHFNLYGLGWFMFDYSARKIVEHDGGMPGYISKVTVVPEEKLGMVILTNDMNILTGALRFKILDLFLNDSDRDWAADFLQFKKRRDEAKEKRDAEKAAKRAVNTKPSLELAQYAGTYQDEMYGNARIEIESDQLKVTLLPTKEKFVSKMEHWHHDVFRIKFKDEFLPEGFVTFGFNSDGEVTGFKIDLPNPDFHFFNLDFKKLRE